MLFYTDDNRTIDLHARKNKVRGFIPDIADPIYSQLKPETKTALSERLSKSMGKTTVK